MSLIKGLCRQFFGNIEQTQTMYIGWSEKFQSINLNKKIDNFQNSHFCSKLFPKIIIFENFASFANLTQMSMRERMEQKIRKTKFWIITHSFSKINQTILSRCLKLYFNFIFPNLTLLRWVEILNKENHIVSLEYLESYLRYFCKKVKKPQLIPSQFSMMRRSNFSKRLFVQYIKLINTVPFNDPAKEEKLVLLRKVKIFLYSDILFNFKGFKNLKQTFYYIFPLIDF